MRNDWPPGRLRPGNYALAEVFTIPEWHRTPAPANIPRNRSSCGSLERTLEIAITSLNVFLVAALLAGHSTCHAQVNKCVDEMSGAVRYTDGPCPSQSKTSTPRLTDNSTDGSQYRRAISEDNRSSRRAQDTQVATESPACSQARADLDRAMYANIMDSKSREKLVRPARLHVEKVCMRDASEMSPSELRNLAQRKEAQAQVPISCFGLSAGWVSCGGRDYPLTEPIRPGGGQSCSISGGFASCW
jgi:uncharacterized membrane protein